MSLAGAVLKTIRSNPYSFQLCLFFFVSFSKIVPMANPDILHTYTFTYHSVRIKPSLSQVSFLFLDIIFCHHHCLFLFFPPIFHSHLPSSRSLSLYLILYPPPSICVSLTIYQFQIFYLFLSLALSLSL